MEKSEIKKVLNLLYERKLSPDDAFNLLEELVEINKQSAKARRMRIYVYNKIKGREEINIAIPASLAKFGTKFLKGKKFKIDDEELDVEIDEAINEALESMQPVEVETTDHSVTITFE
ncbi:MAG: hypothetical protein FXF54_02885 [Kosmotoga sp.]|nr:MAG: hypothetical protein FXF54_02885 [Kosmotoga sp.]